MRWVAILFTFAIVFGRLHAAEPVPVIFDTDMDSDCDDAAALAVLHGLADREEARILATPVSSRNPWAAACTDAINVFYGRRGLPIGGPKSEGASRQGSKYTQQIAAEFPHDVGEESTVPDARGVYRQVLAAAEDGSVVIITVGDLTNLRYLLETPADAVSPLDGRELVRRKVKHWVCMGSRYPADLDPARWGNFKIDPESTVKAVAGWPTLVTFTGGGAFAESLATGARLAELPKTHPVRRVYELYFGGTIRNRHSADQITVMVAVRGPGSPWKLVRQGWNEIFPDGRHAWRETPDNPLQEYVSALCEGVVARSVAGEIEGLMVHAPGVE